MFLRSRFLFITKRGGGSTTSRGVEGFGEYGTLVTPTAAPMIPKHLKDRFRLEKQKHIKEEDAEAASKNCTRPRQYTVCTKCGVSSVVINFDAVPSARLGMYGTCEGGKDYTHHKFRVVSKEDYERMQSMAMRERIQWLFQERWEQERVVLEYFLNNLVLKILSYKYKDAIRLIPKQVFH